MDSATNQSAPDGNRNQQVCCVCLEVAQARGGNEPLASPGCCGKWFHQRCLIELQRNHSNCPCCRAPLPGIAVAAPAAPAPVPARAPPTVTFNVPAAPVQQQVQFQQAIQQQVQPPMPPVQQSSFGNIFSNMFGGRRAANNNTWGSYNVANSGASNDAQMVEDELPMTAPTDASDVTSSSTAAVDTAASGQVSFSLGSAPEYAMIDGRRYASFHAVANISVKENPSIFSSRKAMDIVCVLDTSGSMGGAKLTYLKHAMRFVQSQLNDSDRLSIVTFNSHAKGVHGFSRMTTERKATSENLLNNLQAGGGTDIYAGMQYGYDLLQRRVTKNTISCMFLLTDGIDNSRFAEKKALAANMKAQGTGLFVFAFGADHDATHLNDIATAGESSYIYVESSDEVIDAFGGALGSQQGLAAKNIKLEINALSQGILIDEVSAGQYAVNIAAGSRSASVSFSNLFMGENRDVLVRLNVPALEVPEDIEQYPLFETSATYNPIGETVVSCTTTADENHICNVRRVGGDHTVNVVDRHVEVDAHMYRLRITEALKSAIDMGDNNHIDKARQILQDALKDLETNSISYRAKHAISEQLHVDLKAAISALASQDEYRSRGGKSAMTETYSSNNRQRSCYSKAGRVNAYQSTSSTVMQERSRNYKSSFK